MKPMPYTPTEVKALIAFHRSVREMLASIAANTIPTPSAALPGTDEPVSLGSGPESMAAANASAGKASS